MPTLPLEAFIFAPLIVITAYVIFGISGFGSTVIAVPLLAHFLPLTVVVPMIVALDCIGAIGMGVRLRADVYRQELVPLLPFLMVGMLAGAYLLLELPGDILLGTLGVFVAVYGVLYVTGQLAGVRVGRWAVAPTGIFAGTTSSLFGVGGPIYVMYLNARGATPEHIRATLPVIFIFTTIARIAIFALAGLYTSAVLYMAAALLPIMLLGMWIGHRLHLNLTREQLARIIGALLVVSGVSLVVRAFGT